MGEATLGSAFSGTVEQLVEVLPAQQEHVLDEAAGCCSGSVIGFLQKNPPDAGIEAGLRGESVKMVLQISMISSVRLGAMPSMTSSRTNTFWPTAALPRARSGRRRARRR